MIYAIIPKKIRCLWLLIASYYFYMCWNARYAVLIAFSTFITYVAGLLIEKLESRAAKRTVVIGGFAVNLGILFFFKYFGFALNNVKI